MIRFDKPHILITFLLSSFFVISQNFKDIDSLLLVYSKTPNDTSKVRLLRDLFYATMYNDIELSKKYAFKSLLLAEQIDDKLGIARGNYIIACHYKNLSKIDSSKIYLEKAMQQYTNLNYEYGKFLVNQLLADIAHKLSKYDEALKIYTECIENRIKAEDSSKLANMYIGRAKTHQNIGNIKIAYKDILLALAIHNKIDKPLWKADALYQLGVLDGILKNNKKALDYQLQAYEIYKEYNDKSFMGTAAFGIGYLYAKLNDYENAKKYLKISIELCTEIKDFSYAGAAKRELGIVFIDEGEYKTGISYLLDALEIHKNGINNEHLLNTLTALGNAYNQINKPKEALKHFDEAVLLHKTKALNGYPAPIYWGKSKTLELLKDYQSSLSNYKTYKSLNDSIFNEKKSKQIEELRTIYDTEKKEQQITLQENEITVLEQQAEISNLQKLLLGLGLALSLLVFGIGYYAFRQKIKRNKLEKEKLDTELAFKKKELTTHALHLAKKNEALLSLKEKAEALKISENNTNGYQQLIRTINFDLQDDNNWENFSKYFQEVHKDFNSIVKQKFTDITSNELRLMSLIKMNLSTKEIANILNISIPGVKKARQRLRKKMQLSTNDSLEDAIIAI